VVESIGMGSVETARAVINRIARQFDLGSTGLIESVIGKKPENAKPVEAKK
jgi:hypothetical protein